MTQKTDVGLVQWCKDHLDDGYVYATYFAWLITEAIIQAKAAQYPDVYSASYIQRSRRWIGKDAGDCVGLIKGYYWYEPTSGKVLYKLDGRPDVSANGMYYAGRKIGGRSSDQNFGKTWGWISTIPEIPGMLVWRDGHIGVYVGGGYVIESRGVDYGVVMTRLADRNWTSWVMCPYITYGGESEMTIQKPCTKGQQVYNYQILCKRLGGEVGAFNDMVLKDAAGQPLKTGCDGSYGNAMVAVTNAFCSKFGLPQTTNGLVTDALMGKMQQALMDLETGVSQAEYDQVVNENTEIKYENSQLVLSNNNLKSQMSDMSIDLAKANVKGKAYDELTGALATVKKFIP